MVANSRLQIAEPKTADKSYRWPLHALYESGGVYETMQWRYVDGVAKRGEGRPSERSASRPRRPWNRQRPRPTREEGLVFFPESWCNSLRVAAPSFLFLCDLGTIFIRNVSVFSPLTRPPSVSPPLHLSSRETPINRRNWNRESLWVVRVLANSVRRFRVEYLCDTSDYLT